MKACLICVLAVMASLVAHAQFRLVDGTIYSLTDPNVGWIELRNIHVEDFGEQKGDLLCSTFSYSQVNDGQTFIGGHLYAGHHQERIYSTDRFILRNFPQANLCVAGNDIIGPIYAMRVSYRSSIPNPADSRLTTSFNDNRGYSSQAKTTYSSGVNFLTYDMGVECQPPQKILTPAEQAAAQKKKVVQDKKIFRWIYSQATNGSASAECSLGEHYLNGIGTETNLVAGTNWLVKAADDGNIEASNLLVKLRSTNAPASDDN